MWNHLKNALTEITGDFLGIAAIVLIIFGLYWLAMFLGNPNEPKDPPMYGR